MARTPRGTVEGVAELVQLVMRAGVRKPWIIRQVLTDAGVPSRLLVEGVFVGYERQLDWEASHEKVSTEQGKISEAVSERSAQDEVDQPRKSAPRRHTPVNGVLPSA